MYTVVNKLGIRGYKPSHFETCRKIWKEQISESGQADALASCYKNFLKIAMDNHIRTIAFPSISTGAFGYPVHEAAGVAVGAVREFLAEYPDAFDLVEWVLFDKRTLLVYESAIGANEQTGC